VTSALALALVAAIVWAGIRQRLRAGAMGHPARLVVGADLWINARPFWTYSTEDKNAVSAGPNHRTHQSRAREGSQAVSSTWVARYPGDVLMAFDVPQLLGVHGMELRYFDEVMGGRNEWRNLGNLHLWEMFAVRWVIAPAAAQGLDSIPGFARVLNNTTTSAGRQAQLFERRTPCPTRWSFPPAVSLDSASIVAASLTRDGLRSHRAARCPRGRNRADHANAAAQPGARIGRALGAWADDDRARPRSRGGGLFWWCRRTGIPTGAPPLMGRRQSCYGELDTSPCRFRRRETDRAGLRQHVVSPRKGA